MSKIDFTITKEAFAGTEQNKPAVKRDARIESVVIAFNDPVVAAKYFQGVNTAEGATLLNATNVNEVHSDVKLTPKASAPADVVGGQVKVGLTLTINDIWGMSTVVPFEVTVKTK